MIEDCCVLEDKFDYYGIFICGVWLFKIYLIKRFFVVFNF